MSEYLTVAEFSRLAKLPKAKIYRLLTEDEYQKYIEPDSVIKRVSIDLLEVLQGKEQAAESPAEQKTKDAENTAQVEEIEIVRLRRENAELKEQIRQKDSQLIEYASKFAELAAQAQVIAGQAQVLQLSERSQKVIAETTIKPQKKQNIFQRFFHR